MTEQACRFGRFDCVTHNTVGHADICDLGLAALRADLTWYRTVITEEMGVDAPPGDTVNPLREWLQELRGLRATVEEQARVMATIIYASDGCKGHVGCNHSMKPWQDARALMEKQQEALSPTEPPDATTRPNCL